MSIQVTVIECYAKKKELIMSSFVI